MYLIILIVLVYYQLLRDAQALLDDERKAHKATRTGWQGLTSWYNNHKKPQVEQLKVTNVDLKTTNQTLTKEIVSLKVNHTPNNISEKYY